MRLTMLRLLVLAALSVGLSIPTMALGHDDSKSIQHNYTSAYKQCQRAAGKNTCGRNIRRDGVNAKGKDRAAAKKDYRRSIPTLKSITYVALHPAPKVTYKAASTSTSTSTGGGGSCPAVIPQYIIQKESGGNPNAVNSSSGAFGCYQLMPMHYSAGGACADLGRDVAGQAACAQRLPPSAWNATR